MALSVHDASERVEQMTILTERLTALIAREAQAFEQHRPQDVAGQIEETARLANLYRHESARVRADPGLVAAAPANLRARLMRVTEAFDAVLARQGRALAAAKTVTEGLVRAIADEITAQRTSTSSYGPGAETSAPHAAMAITLNRRA